MPYAGYPSAVVYKTPGDTNKKNAVQNVIWGDWLKRLGPTEGKWMKVRVRGETGWILEDEIQENRLLEMDFVDIGQGDGSFIVTPDDKFLIVDAGEGDNMHRFLHWRFSGFKKELTFESAIITHSDGDHYAGFAPLFKEPNVRFKTLYHNGIVERAGEDPLGPRTKWEKRIYLTDVIVDRQALTRVINDPEKCEKKAYPSLLKLASESGRVEDIRMLCSEDGFLPGYGLDKELSIRALGPVPEKGPKGERWLRWFESPQKTKNGHSVALQFRYKKVLILLGGDLNTLSERYLLTSYTGLDSEPKTPGGEEALILAARRTFESDVAKACHHGSGDFTELYLQAVNPLATIVSSGDDESYSHPRPDTLGAIGKYGRGPRPLIFSTELARSAKENIKYPYLLRKQIDDLTLEFDKAETEKDKKAIQKRLDEVTKTLERSIAVYGMINLRTDGEKVILAQKLEEPKSNAEKWDIHQLEPGPDGCLRYIQD